MIDRLDARSGSQVPDLAMIDEVVGLALRATSFDQLAEGLVAAGVDVDAPGPAPQLWALATRVAEVGRARIRAEDAARQSAAHDQRAEARGQRLKAAVESEQRRVTQLQVLNQLAITLNGEIDAGRMVDEVLAGALQLTGALGGSFYLVERADLRLQAFTTSPDLASRISNARQTGVDIKALAREAVVTRSLLRSTGAGAGGAGSARGYLAAPLITAEGQALACLVLVGASGEGGFTAEDEMLAATLAAHTAVALQNGRRLAQEHDIAEYLQKAMLPAIPRIPGVEIDVAYASATDATLVGGDFFDVIPLKRNRTALIVGDVCGKGLRAATRMAAVRHTLRAYAVLDPDPGEWLTMANESLASEAALSEFVTAALVVVDAGHRRLDYVLAGHPGPLLVSTRGVIELAGAHDLPLGVDRGQRYHTRTVEAADDSTLILFTDGLYEARSGTYLFGTERLAAAAGARAESPLAGSADRLVAEARAFSGGRLADDVVVLMARFSGR